jgi:hypothetical protein
MREDQPYRFVRIIVDKDGVLKWYGPIVCVRHEGQPRGGEVSVSEFENKLQEAAQLYGHANVDSTLCDAKLLSEAEFYFGNMGVEELMV